MSRMRKAALGRPWRKDFTQVEPVARRTARYALRMLACCPMLHKRLSDDDFLGPLWVMTVPLLDPAKLAELEAEWSRTDGEEGAVSGDEDVLDGQWFQVLDMHNGYRFPRGVPGARMRDYLVTLFSSIPDSVLARLTRDDGIAPTHPSVAVLAECAGLNEIERHVLDFIEKKENVAPFRPFLRETGCEASRDRYACLAAALDVTTVRLRQNLGRKSALAILHLAKRAGRRSDLEDFVQAGDLFEDILGLEPTTPEGLLDAVVEPATVADCMLQDFPHLAADGARLCGVLGKAAATRVVGVNALFYGPPGSGKTQFASAVALAAGLKAYRVKSADDDGDGLSRAGRLGAYQLTQRLLRGRSDCVVVFDEVEDAFGNAESALLAYFAGHAKAGGDKGWMNRTLEDNPLPAIWITNDVESMDPAFLRRFLLPVAFSTPPRRVRRQMIERHLGGTAVSAAALDELAADSALMPAQYGAARRLLDLCEGAEPESVVREGIAAARRVLHGAVGPRPRRPATTFDVAYLNIAGGPSPSRLADALARNGRGALCFFGPPGTGKTEFAHVLADALDRELVVQASSDLVSPYVGETERNIARLFAGIDTGHSVLLIDEVDSLLRDRSHAQRSWEATQVNELLQQIERYHGIFIAATNLMSQLDGAAMRRFDFKLSFRPLSRAQRLALFAREVLGAADRVAAIPHALVARIDTLEMLTPGDFANVVRQRELLGEELSPEEFLRQLIVECRYKDGR
ncbi:AAA family ATPase [Azoarcus olearius]|uniref:Conserved hypothetical ATPase n=1 Tax=Azoarcus sp. (strain BH72) TaxID=418699 RepID=A1K8V0_AZOSB|nr:AAA family ATPase [Azoarcus olearius]CAL95255.1 conserved hypothetical ATPase [Azoarcus olearius]